ncbi:MAG: stage II sporulation protein P [Firmicutes bacterium]|nr:stage II sporulation protein P [Bacillota bacterium]
MVPAPACRFRRMYTAGGRRPVIAVSFMVVAFFFLLRMLSVTGISVSLTEAGKAIPAGVIAIYQKEPLKILKTAMPVLGWRRFEGDYQDITLSQSFRNLMGALGGVSLSSPASLLQSQIPLLAAVEPPAVMIVSRPEDAAARLPAEETVSPLPGECWVSIYNTHTGETYSLTDGVERLDGKRGGVVTEAAALQETLENKHGIKVARSDRINDLIYNNSYIESENTARELLAGHPETRVLLDIHRDSGKPREQSVVTVNGQQAAPILFIVGSDARRPFPTWRQNYAFAVHLAARMNEMYPGLCLGVRVKDGVYNQCLHPRALLVEVGTTNNSIEEAVLSARFLADALAGVLAGMENEKSQAEPEVE